jgi:hypothetical protein
VNIKPAVKRLAAVLSEPHVLQHTDQVGSTISSMLKKPRLCAPEKFLPFIDSLNTMTTDGLCPSFQGIQIYVSACFVHTLRITAPEAPFSEETLQVCYGRHVTLHMTRTDLDHTLVFLLLANAVSVAYVETCTCLTVPFPCPLAVDVFEGASQYGLAAKAIGTMLSHLLIHFAYDIQGAA